MQQNDFLLRFKCGEIRQISLDEAKTKWPKLLKAFCTKNPGFGIFFAGSEEINAPKNKPAKRTTRSKSVFSESSQSARPAMRMTRSNSVFSESSRSYRPASAESKNQLKGMPSTSASGKHSGSM